MGDREIPMDLRVEKVSEFSIVERIPRIRISSSSLSFGRSGPGLTSSLFSVTSSLRHSVTFIMGGRSHTVHLHKLG
jgi:hypothetical protein